MKPASGADLGRLARLRLDQIQLTAMGGERQTPVGEVGEPDDAVVLLDRLLAEVVSERRRRELLQFAVVLDQRNRGLPFSRFPYPWHVHVAVDIGQEVARGVPSDRTDHRALRAAVGGVVLVEDMIPVAEDVNVSTDATRGDQTLGDRHQVLPRPRVRVDAPQVSAPPGQRRAVIARAVLIRGRRSTANHRPP